MQQVSVRQSDPQQGVVVFPSLSLLLLFSHGLSAQHGVPLYQFSPTHTHTHIRLCDIYLFKGKLLKLFASADRTSAAAPS